MADLLLMDSYTHTANSRTWRLYGCAKRGCDRVNPDYESFGAGGKSYCLDHTPSERWFAWAGRHGFGFRAGRIEMQVYWYAGKKARRG